MNVDEWNKDDSLDLTLYSTAYPIGQGFAGLEPVLDILEATGRELRPKNINFKRKRKYSRQILQERLEEETFQGTVQLLFGCSRFPNGHFGVSCSLKVPEEERSSLDLYVRPLSVFREPGKAEERVSRLVDLTRAFASRFPVSYGYAHSGTDHAMGNMEREGPRSSFREAYWLNVLGPKLVEQLGRQRVLSTPAFLLEELPGGAVLFLTRPTPTDFASEEARLAQARALVHLRPELSLDSTLTTLRQRSLEFSPIPMEFDPDVADIRGPLRRAARRPVPRGCAPGHERLPGRPSSSRLAPVACQLGQAPVPRAARGSRPGSGGLPRHLPGLGAGRPLGAAQEAGRDRGYHR